jgi:hypothetical protein
MMIDFHVYPMVERIIMLENGPLHEWFEKLKIKSKCPLMYEYVHRFRSNPLLKPYVISHEAYGKLIDKRLKLRGIKPMLDFEMLDHDLK